MDFIMNFIGGLPGTEHIQVYISKSQKDLLDTLANKEGNVYIVNELRFTLEVVRNT